MTVLERQARLFFLRCRHDLVHGGRTIKLKRCTQPFQRRYATNASNPDTAARKPYYVTSPIFYVNASPHAGHLYTIVLTDILKRWQVLRGDTEAKLLTGTDEHGMKIQKAAEKAGVDVKLFCDQHAQQFENLADKAGISYDRFIRTTDQDHKEAVEHFWRELNHRGYIYESQHKGWYSVSDETFYPESAVHLILDPSSGRKLYASIETGKEVEWTSETNYHFKLSHFKDQLLKHYRDNPDFIVPTQRMNFIIKEVESGLSDLSISRPSSRLTWGIRVPGDDSQTIYVWLDALINYLTMTGYPFATKAQEEALWPPNCSVIGKDIIRFHCIYWPAFLMAVGLPLPKQFLTHAHWTMGREKMSKSLGNVVNPFFAMNRYDVDTIRFYMAHDGGIVDDSAYENSFIVERYKKALQSGFGNLISRLTRSKKWDVRACVVAADTNGEKRPLVSASETHVNNLNKVAARANELMEGLNPRQAVQAIMDVIYATNKYFADMAVWDMANQSDEKVKQELMSILYITAESLRISAILLQPFMPTKMSRALNMLGVSTEKRSFEYATYGADFSYGTSTVDLGKAGPDGTLFPPLPTEW